MTLVSLNDGTAAARGYARLQALARRDRSDGFLTLALIAALVRGDEEAWALCEYPGAAVYLTPDVAPAEWLQLLAAATGARLLPSMTEAEQRTEIDSPFDRRRGTNPAIVELTRRYLTGDNPYVGLIERSDPDSPAADAPDDLTIITALSQTPNLRPAEFSAATWFADAEEPWEEEWTSYAAAARSRITRVPSPHTPGRSALRFTVIDGDDAHVWNDPYNDPDPLLTTSVGERAEVSSANPTGPNGTYPTDGNTHYHVFREGDDRWIGQQLYLPSTSVIGPGFTVITQLKALGSGGGSPVLALGLARSTPLGLTRFRVLATNNPDPTYVPSSSAEVAAINIPLDQLVKVLWRVKFHRDPTQGHVTCLVDIGAGFVTVLAQTAMTTMCDADPASGGNLIIPNWDTEPMSLARMGIYRDPTNTGDATIYFDGFAVSDSRPVVEHLAFGTALTPDNAGDGVVAWKAPLLDAAWERVVPVDVTVHHLLSDGPLINQGTLTIDDVAVPIDSATLADIT